MNPPSQLHPLTRTTEQIGYLRNDHTGCRANIPLSVAAIPYVIGIINFVPCAIHSELIAKSIHFTRPKG